MTKENHIEYSVGGTTIIACGGCPLTREEVSPKQLRSPNYKGGVVLCVKDSASLREAKVGYVCRHFRRAVQGASGFQIECAKIDNR